MDNLTIWKYPLKATEKQEISMPSQARILSVQTQNDQPYVWALVDPKMPLAKKPVYVFNTGDTIPNKFRNGVYVGTFQLTEGSLVLHVFTETY